MSDSDDDNVYSDYLSKRRNTVKQKRAPVEAYDSDSDDGLEALHAPKRKREDDMLDSDEEESFVTSAVETHTQKLKNTMEDLEEAYRKTFFNDNDGMIRNNPKDRNDALSKVMKTVQSLVPVVNKSPEPKDKVQMATREVEVAVADVSTGSFPVALIIMDYESRGGEIKNRRDLPLEASFFEIRKELAEKWNCRYDQVNLIYNGMNIEDTMTPKSLGFRPLELPQRIDANKLGGAGSVVAPASAPPAPVTEVITVENVPDSMMLKVQLKNRKKPVHIEATEDTTILELKKKIIRALLEEGDKKIPTPEKMKVMFDDEYLTDDNETCKGIGLEDADCIDIFY